MLSLFRWRTAQALNDAASWWSALSNYGGQGSLIVAFWLAYRLIRQAHADSDASANRRIELEESIGENLRAALDAAYDEITELRRENEDLRRRKS